jgi:hypothetical protein
MGWFTLLTLTAMAAVGSLAAARRGLPAGRAELGVLAALIFFALLALPVLALGYAGQLRPRPLALLSALLSASTFALASRGMPPGAGLIDVARAARALAALPGEALGEAWRARSLVLVGLLFSAGLLLLGAVVTYLAPAESWDGFHYHDPIVGFALQNAGFSAVPLPPREMVQATNGYPRLGEALSLWFVIFTDRTLIELPNLLAAPPLLLAAHALARRHLDRLSALACAPILLLLPGLWSQLRTTYIDIEVSFFVTSAILFGTSPRGRVRDAAAATLAMALFAGSKMTALAWVPPFALVVFGRLLARHRAGRPRAAWGASVVGGLILLATLLFTPLRNARAFHSPLWPVACSNATLGVRWSGLSTLGTLMPHPSPREWFSIKTAAPQGGVDDIVHRDYGQAFPWLLAPLGLLGALLSLIEAAQEARRRERGPARTFAWLLLAAALSLAVTPSLYPVRFNVAAVLILMVAGLRLVQAESRGRLREGLIGAAIALSVIPLFWTQGWYLGISWPRLRELALHPAAERAAMYSEPYGMSESVARLREREIGAGDRVSFGEEIICPGVLWNDHFSNEIAYLPFQSQESFLARLDAYGPRWAVVGAFSPGRAALESRPQAWEYVGESTRIDRGQIYRRR